MDNNWFIKLSIKHYWLWYIFTFPTILMLFLLAIASSFNTACRMFGKVFSVHMEFIKAPSKQNWESFKKRHTNTQKDKPISIEDGIGGNNEYN